MLSKQRVWRVSSILILAGLLLALTEVFASKPAGVFKQLDLLLEVRHELVNNYVDEPDEEEMIESAVEGMIESLRDPYTVFVPNKHLEQFEDRLTGSFSGIGAEIDVQDGLPRIVTPLEDSPAWEAGIAAGDMILAVDGEPTRGVNLMDLIKRIKGEAGTDVVLRVRRVTGDEMDIAITRAQINVQTVRGARRRADQSYDFMLDPESKIGYVRLSQFTEPTADDLRSALDSLNEQGARGLILDLRFDPGGLLSTAVKVSDMFLTEGKRIVSTNGRAWPEQVFDSSDDTVMPDLPMVVLANERSASASEVVTGALSDNGRALFVGTRTFGKGSVQQVRGLDSGLGALKMTGAYYYLPSGRNIHKKPDAEVWGVDPDEGAYVPMTFEQYEQMILARREADTVRKDNGHGLDSPVTPEYVETEMKDPQLAAGLRAVLGKLETGDWPTVGLSNAEELVKQHDRELLQRRRNLLLEELHKVEAELADGADEDETLIIQTKLDAPDAGSTLDLAEFLLEPQLESDPSPQPEQNPEAKSEATPAVQPTTEPKPALEPKKEAGPTEQPATQPKPATQP